MQPLDVRHKGRDGEGRGPYAIHHGGRSSQAADSACDRVGESYHFADRASRSAISLASSCSCWAIRSAVLASSPAPEKAAACSTNSAIFWRITAMRSSISLIVGPPFIDPLLMGGPVEHSSKRTFRQTC